MQLRAVLCFASCLLSPGRPLAQDSIVVVETETSCYGGDHRSYAWRLESDGYHWDNEVLSLSDVASIREQILATEHSTPDLAAQVGVNAASIAAHIGEILEAAWPTMSLTSRATRTEAATQLDALLTPAHLAAHLEAMLVGPYVSTTRYSLSIQMPGDPHLTIWSDAHQPWMLPWEIRAGSRRWRTSDIAVPRAIHRLLDPRGLNAALVDGTKYWTEDFWRDASVWSHVLGPAIERMIVLQACRALRGFDRTVGRLSIDAASVPDDYRPESLRVDISFLDTSVIDFARWWNPLQDGEPTASWSDFLALHDSAMWCVATRRWLLEWRQQNPDRRIGFDAVGRVGYVESDLRTIAMRAWRHAGLAGDPEIEVQLMRDGEVCATIWLSTLETSALVTKSERGPCDHFLDRVWIEFGPGRISYGIVDASGVFELRTIRD